MPDPNIKKEHAAEPANISRRDFLRRASTEAVKTGTKIVPGAALASKAMGIDLDRNDSGTSTPESQSLLGRFAAWRQRNRNGTKNKL